MIDLNSTANKKVIEEGNKIIKSITKCVERGEIEKGVKRGKCHVLLDNNNKCVCGDVDLTKYSKMALK